MNNKSRVTYNGNEEENYTLLFDGKEVGNIPTGEDGAIDIARRCNSFINARLDLEPVVQVDDNKVAVDLYEGKDWIDGITMWIKDFQY